MTTREKWLARARNSKAGWRASDMEHLYLAWGFQMVQRGRDTKYVHSQHKDLVAFVTRSSGEISKAYIDDALELIDELIARGYTA